MIPTMRGLMLTLLGSVMTVSSCPAATTPSVAEIVRIHVAALGGRERIAALKAFRASGHVTSDGKDVPFTIIAARPNRLRMQYDYPAGELVQATDGVHPPWEIDRRVLPARNTLMEPVAAKEFTASADFDDPLLSANEHGDTIEYAGTTVAKGRPMIRLLITHGLTQSFYLLLDAETYLIASRIDPPRTAGADRSEYVTEYASYRPIGDVLAAFSVTVWINGRISEEATLDNAEANPDLSVGFFSRPSTTRARNAPAERNGRAR